MPTDKQRRDEQERRWNLWEDRIRSIILFTAGIYFLVRELSMEDPRPDALLLIMTIIGGGTLYEVTKRGK